MIKKMPVLFVLILLAACASASSSTAELNGCRRDKSVCYDFMKDCQYDPNVMNEIRGCNHGLHAYSEYYNSGYYWCCPHQPEGFHPVPEATWFAIPAIAGPVSAIIGLVSLSMVMLFLRRQLPAGDLQNLREDCRLPARRALDGLAILPWLYFLMYASWALCWQSPGQLINVPGSLMFYGWTYCTVKKSIDKDKEGCKPCVQNTIGCFAVLNVILAPLFIGVAASGACGVALMPAWQLPIGAAFFVITANLKKLSELRGKHGGWRVAGGGATGVQPIVPVIVEATAVGEQMPQPAVAVGQVIGGVAGGATSLSDRLEQLQAALKQGVLTEAEYTEARRRAVEAVAVDPSGGGKSEAGAAPPVAWAV